jgi:fatty acid-binding protein DegV
LSCSSTADLTKEHLEERDIKYIYFHFHLDGKEYFDDLGAEEIQCDFQASAADS